jgi:hypothetical protein
MRTRWSAAAATLLSLLASACHERKLVNLEPPDKNPVYRVTVDDAEETALLQQKFGVRPVRQDGRAFYFQDPLGSVKQMPSFGYSPESADLEEIYFRIVKVGKRGDEKSLSARGVLVLNREPDYWLVRGSLAQLQALQNDGYRLTALTGEPGPRRATLTIKDEQRDIVVRSLVDIVDSSGDAKSGFQLTVLAFDYQLDRLREAGIPFTVVQR